MATKGPILPAIIDFMRYTHAPSIVVATEAAMNQEKNPKKATLLKKMGDQYAGALTPIALSALSAWLIVTGIKGLAGFDITQQTAFADLVGILIVVAIARGMSSRSNNQ